MTKYKNLIIIIFNIMLVIMILFNKDLVTKTIISSLTIWFNTIMPAILPITILSDILINYNFQEAVPENIKNIISKMFNISTNASSIFLLTLISGFPTNAVIIKEAYLNKLVSKKECEHLLYFTSFANPLFILSTIGSFYLHNNKYGIIILLSHFLSNIIIAIILKNNNTYSNNNYILKKNQCQSFIKVLTSSINKSINTILIVATTITVFLILTTLTCKILNLNIFFKIILSSLMEMNLAINIITNTSINIKIKISLIAAIVSFGGMSIHLQVISIIDDLFSYKSYLIGRMLSFIITLILTFIIINVI